MRVERPGAYRCVRVLANVCKRWRLRIDTHLAKPVDARSWVTASGHRGVWMGCRGGGGSNPLARASVPLSRGRGLYALTRPGYSGCPGALPWMAPGVYRQMCGWRVVGDTAVPACVSSRLRTPRRWSRLPPAARSPLLRYQPAGQTSSPTTSRGSQHSGPKTASRPARRW